MYLNVNEFNYNFGNNKKYHYIAVTNLNALLAKLLSIYDGNKCPLNMYQYFSK